MTNYFGEESSSTEENLSTYLEITAKISLKLLQNLPIFFFLFFFLQEKLFFTTYTDIARAEMLEELLFRSY